MGSRKYNDVMTKQLIESEEGYFVCECGIKYFDD